MLHEQVSIHKLDDQGVETWRYEGVIVDRSTNSITLHAHFDREEVQFFGIKLEPNDLFVETFFSNRWYNIFSIYTPDGEQHKGWYCNITRPAKFEDGHIYAEDLALDLLVYPDGRQQILDEDEFLSLELSEVERNTALQALTDLQELAKARLGPFKP